MCIHQLPDQGILLSQAKLSQPVLFVLLSRVLFVGPVRSRSEDDHVFYRAIMTHHVQKHASCIRQRGRNPGDLYGDDGYKVARRTHLHLSKIAPMIPRLGAPVQKEVRWSL
jgi:hypothetical protein